MFLNCFLLICFTCRWWLRTWFSTSLLCTEPTNPTNTKYNTPIAITGCWCISSTRSQYLSFTSCQCRIRWPIRRWLGWWLSRWQPSDTATVTATAAAATTATAKTRAKVRFDFLIDYPFFYINARQWPLFLTLHCIVVEMCRRVRLSLCAVRWHDFLMYLSLCCHRCHSLRSQTPFSSSSLTVSLHYKLTLTHYNQ